MAGNECIDASLASLGYSRVTTNVREWADVHHPSVYRATGHSDEVEHFLYVGGGIRRHQDAVAKFGFRSPVVEEFSINALLKYGHPNFGQWIAQHDRQIGCIMNFNLDCLHLPDKQRCIPLPLASRELTHYVTTTASARLLPIVRDARSFTGLFRLLASDVEPCTWLVSHGIARAAQVVTLGRLLDVPREAIAGFLAPHHALYSRHVPDPDIRSSVDYFVDRLIEDWERRNN